MKEIFAGSQMTLFLTVITSTYEWKLRRRGPVSRRLVWVRGLLYLRPFRER